MKGPLQLLERGEGWFACRLGLDDLFAGDAPVELRRERVRAVLEEGGMGLLIAGRGPTGKCESYAQAFERIYGQKLTGAK